MPFIIVRNDITKMPVDAIVNAANNTLLGGGGVDGAIHRAAGRELLSECRTLNGCETGEAKATKGYKLPAKYVIHTVGPVWHGGDRNDEALLSSCYDNSLRIAEELGCESLAFPLISAGVYGYPKREAVRVASSRIERFLETHEMTVYLVIFDWASYETFGSGELNRRVAEFIDDKYVEEHGDSREVRLARSLLARAEAAPRKKAAPMKEADMADAMSEAMEAMPAAAAQYSAPQASCPQNKPLEEMLESLDESFSQNLLRRIDLSGMTDAECYKRANIDRKLFSKIRGDVHYRPKKSTVLAFAIALRLDLGGTNDLLRRAGFALSHSSKFDVIVEYFITNGVYDVFRINETLFAFDQPLLGS